MGLLEGETLGEKHRHYNKIVKEFASKNESEQIQKINYDEPDIDNLFKIDVASKKKQLNYILEVLKSEDMLYVSRAIKTSVWLITDKEYAHIINPICVHTELLPHMTSKAGHKLILKIRLNLKDEKRVEEFYEYYKDKKDLKTAFKWLPNCSVSFIENVVEKHAKQIPYDLILRLFEKSITILEICTRHEHNDVRSLLSKSTFLLNEHPENFLKIVNSQKVYHIPRFSAKATAIIMKTNPDIILNDFEKYATKINIPTFTKFLKKEDIRAFLMKHFENKNLVKSWFNFKTMKHFIFRIPSEGRFDFIKRICIEKVGYKNSQGLPDDFEEDTIALFCASKCLTQSSNENVYKWYRFAPFDTAFTDLIKLISMESNPTERNAMFAVLISCARRNSQNIQTILKYYRGHHINEPFKFKIHFVNIILSLSYSHKFDENTWAILNDIFCSMEVYSEKENNVQSCLKHIIVYKVVHDLKVPDVVEKKFEFNTLKSFQSKLTDKEKDKVFIYLYQFTLTNIQSIAITSESDLTTIKQNIVCVLNLLKDWNKDILDYGIILEKIREVIRFKVDKSWNEDLSIIYNIKKSWRKTMFNESVLLHPCQETCMNALKHGPQLLVLSQENMCLSDSMLLSRLLSKLRIYWPQSLAKAFENIFNNQLENKSKHKISIRGLCILLSQKRLNDMLCKYAPDGMKINWQEINETTLGIQKCLAKYMHLARPQPPVEIVLKYAKGDYLQFALPSVHSILFNMSVTGSLEHIPILLDAPVSLQKHGLKIAFAKLKTAELVEICKSKWKCTKNASIRATIFKLIFDLLCKEQNVLIMKEIWLVLSSFIDSLTPDENRYIFETLSLANKVPIPIKAEICMKSYIYLKSLPHISNSHIFADRVIKSALDVMEFMDVEFISEVVFESFDNKFTKTYYNLENVISAFLLSAKTESIQTQRYERVLLPLLIKYIAFTKEVENNQYNLKYNFYCVMKQLQENINDIVLEKDMITPIKLFTDIHLYLDRNLSGENYYVLISTWRLAAELMKAIDKYRFNTDNEVLKYSKNKSDESKWAIIFLKAAPAFGKICVAQLKEEKIKYYPSIYTLFSKAILEIFNRFWFTDKIKLAILKSIQEHADIIEGHLMVLELLPFNLSESEDKEEKSKICKTLGAHPSAEVRMPYQQMLRVMEIFEA